MDKEKLRKEIEHILMYNDVEWFVDSITDKILEVIERECRSANYEGYRTAMIERSGTIGCSWDD